MCCFALRFLTVCTFSAIAQGTVGASPALALHTQQLNQMALNQQPDKNIPTGSEDQVYGADQTAIRQDAEDGLVAWQSSEDGQASESAAEVELVDYDWAPGEYSEGALSHAATLALHLCLTLLPSHCTSISRCYPRTAPLSYAATLALQLFLTLLPSHCSSFSRCYPHTDPTT